MSFSHGKIANTQIGDATNTLVDISSITNTTDMPVSTGTAETTHFGDTDKEYISGLRDGTVSIGGLYDNVLDATISAAMDSIANGTNATLKVQYGPQGTATGKPKLSCNVVWTNYTISTPIGGAATFKLDGQRSGPITRTTFP